jgi:hypothetical protein
VRPNEPDTPWPWPGDSPLERRSRVARTYRDRLAKEAPDACAEVDASMRRLKQTWVMPKRTPLDLDELWTAEQTADFCDAQPRTIAEWRRRGLKVTDTPDGPRYRVRDILDYHAERRLRRAGDPQHRDQP